jgi:PAS domain S-box-containing protein
MTSLHDELQKGAHFSPDSQGYRDLLDILPDAVFAIDGDRRIRAMNPAAGELLGFEPAETLGRDCEEVLRCAYCGPLCAAREALQQAVTQKGFPCEIHRRDGEPRSVVIDAVPVGNSHVTVIVRDITAGERVRKALKERWVFHGMVCVSPVMKDVVDRVRDVAPYDSTVLICGESGTGKELVARALHAESPRAKNPFVAVNCSAYAENPLESELFGQARGGFTTTEHNRPGRLELADGGTVFLDEIGEVSPKIQVKLLRVLQEGEFERVGESRPRSVDLRVVAATNRDLRRDVEEGRFREDLYYRLNVFNLSLPPLRERREDVPALADYFLGRLRDRTGKEVNAFGDDVIEAFARYPWPGNVRELENVVESALVRARKNTIMIGDLPDALRTREVVAAQPEERLRAALQRAAGNVTRAARLLGVHRTTLWRQMREAGLRRDDFLPS